MIDAVRKTQAFTLIELIVVIALISTTLAFAIPRLDLSPLSGPERKLSNWIMLNVRSAKDTAVNQKVVLLLNVDLDRHLMWISPETGIEESEAAEEAPRENEFRLPGGYRLRDVEFPRTGKKTAGVVPIRFYPGGYSDLAIIHIEDADDETVSFRIEPFLPQVKKYNHYAEFK